MKVEITAPADIAMLTLSQDDRQEVLTWLGHLKNWEKDEHVRGRSPRLPSAKNTYVLQGNRDIRLFFSVEGDTITVYDIAKRSAILTFGHATAGEG